MFCLSHLWTIWHVFLWDLESIKIIYNFFWTIWHIFLWDLQSIEIEVVLSPNYITVSNNICEEFIVNVVIRHYEYVKGHCKSNRVLGLVRTLSLLIFYWVHSINMYSSRAWAFIWCWTRLALFVQVQNNLCNTFIARFIITYEVLSLVMCTHIWMFSVGACQLASSHFFAMFWLLNWMAWQHCVLLGLLQGWLDYMHSSF